MHLEHCLISSQKILTVLYYSSTITMKIYFLKFCVLQIRLLAIGRSFVRSEVSPFSFKKLLEHLNTLYLDMDSELLHVE